MTMPFPTVGSDGRTAVAARLEVARATADAFVACNGGLVATICSGSTGRGHADRWSDLELTVLWSQPPRAEHREAAVVAVGGGAARFFPYDEQSRSWFDEWWTGGQAGQGLLVEIVHTTVEGAHALLDRLVVGHEPEEWLLSMAAAYAYGLPLTGDARNVLARLETYPRGLAVAVITRHGQIDNFWRWQAFVQRGDAHGLRRHFAGVAGALVHIACALNGRWWPGTKWPTWAIGDLEICPPGLAKRLHDVAPQDAEPAAQSLQSLAEETYDLVEARLPEVDVARLRRILRFTREPWPA